jgi:hypothetical protein
MECHTDHANDSEHVDVDDDVRHSASGLIARRALCAEFAVDDEVGTRVAGTVLLDRRDDRRIVVDVGADARRTAGWWGRIDVEHGDAGFALEAAAATA